MPILGTGLAARRRAAAWLLLLASLAGSARADEPFEGLLVSKGSGMGQEITMTLYVGSEGLRSEVQTRSPRISTRLVQVIDFEQPGVAYQLDDEKRVYLELDVARAAAAAPPAEGFRVEKLGAETVRGHPCQHARVRDPLGNEFEVWTSREILDYERVSRALASGPMAQTGLTPALRAEGVDGFFVRMVQRVGGQVSFELELERVERRELEAELFRVPEGYTRVGR